MELIKMIVFPDGTTMIKYSGIIVSLDQIVYFIVTGKLKDLGWIDTIITVDQMKRTKKIFPFI
jgi:hypothetical protein